MSAHDPAPSAMPSGMPPHRQHRGLPVPVACMSFDPGTLYAVADVILKRLRVNHSNTRAGSYVLGGHDGKIYVIAEGSSTGHVVVREHEHMIVGRYAATFADGSSRGPRFPDHKDLTDDLRAFYIELRA